MTAEAATHRARMVTTTDIAAAAQLACLLEVSAPKPGNVSPGRNFQDTSHEDFLASAAAIGAPLADAGRLSVGETVLRSITETRRWTSANTNLGIVLLLAPLARATALAAEDWLETSDPLETLQSSLTNVLRTTTVADARAVYAAIRLAAPGGLGRVTAQDVQSEPTVTLLEAMGLAASRDAIAREYVTMFNMTFTTGVPALTAARRDDLSWSDAIVETYLVLLSKAPDTHVARRAGGIEAERVSMTARSVLDLGGVRTGAGQEAIRDMDRSLRLDGNRSNPGATADLTAASIFVGLMTGAWHPGGGGS